MTVSRELLMRYHDAEVSEAEARVVEAALEQEPALLEELEAYADLGRFVRASNSARTASAVQAFDIADSVMAALPQRIAPRPPARVQSLLPRIATWVSLGAAIAAGSVLVVRSWSAPIAPPGHGARGSHSSAEQAPAAQAAAPDLSAAPEFAAALQGEEVPKLDPAVIESVDFGSNTTGSVFVVSTDSSETPVVWLPDDGEPDEDNEDRSESL